jgi:parallel beta-helix repeat protein
VRGRKASAALVVVVILSSFSVIVTILPENVRAQTLSVGGTGPGNYTSIQTAIGDANPGDTVLIFPGTYFEPIVIDKSINVMGRDQNTSIIDGIGSTVAVNVTSDWVNVTDLSVKITLPSGDSAVVELFDVSDCHLDRLSLSDAIHGLRMIKSSKNLVSNLTVAGVVYGVTVQNSFSNQIRNSTIDEMGGHGIRLTDSYENTVAGNEYDYILLWGGGSNKVLWNKGELYLEGSHGNILANNTHYDEVYLDYSHNNTITNNTNLGPDLRIRVFHSHNTTIINNSAPNADYIEVSLTESSHARLFDQTMVGNGMNESGGLYIDGYSLEKWNTHTIDTSNTLNGGPVYYWKNITGGTVPADAGQVILANCSGVLAENLNISGAVTAVGLGFSSNNTVWNSNLTENFYTILLQESDDNLISRIHAPAAWDAIELWTSDNNTILNSDLGYVYADESSYNTIKDNNISHYQAGISLYYSSDHNTVDNNTASWFGIGVYLSGWNTISNNTVFGDSWGIYLDEADSNVILNNTISTEDCPGISSVASHSNRISGNIIPQSEGGIELFGSSKTTLTDNAMIGSGVHVVGNLLDHWNTHDVDSSNTANSKPVYYWANATGGTIPAGAGQVILANSSYVIVENQNLSNTHFGANIGFSSNNTIRNITAYHNEVGIYLYYSHFNRIHNSTIASLNFLRTRAIYLRNSNSNVMANNTLMNSETGLFLYLGSTNNTIAGNNISLCHYGLTVQDSDGNRIRNNTVLLNTKRGIYASGVGNSIYHNNVVANAVQAWDSGTSNQWHDGYPSGGNYWSDYGGSDIKSGPNQDQPGSDGIGDLPYSLTGETDRYPLMLPTGGMPLLPPPAPQNLQAFPGDGEVNLTWNASAYVGPYPVTNYSLYRGFTPGSKTLLVKLGDVLNHTDSNLVNGWTYFYAVCAESEIGCGPMSNTVNATPTTIPGAPVIIDTKLSGNGLENVTLSWDLSSDDGTGQDSIVEYGIYRNNNYVSNGSGYSLIASVPRGTIEFEDSFVGEGDPSNYFYRVCAVDLNDRTNCSMNQGAKFTKSLPVGTNLVSLPLVQTDQMIDSVLQTVTYDKAWYYDSFGKEWKSQIKSKPFGSTLRSLNHSMGIWIDVATSSNLTVAGVVPSITSVQLKAGWNLVGFPSFNATYTVADLKAETGAIRVEGYDQTSPPYLLRELQDSDILLAGEGYWIYVPVDAIWTVQNS